ncbi:putative auxin efflux carrier component 5 [Hordeum vulgare]|uniref:Auxin efflux carrier component n=1 Tax=Hordeum vulgare subsp. vulgare TaxID=112509 RepID=A0A8I6XRG7_HORVV|nr:probable auxin efflux carrier component 9 isoform X1 [Hordeum vulgare subsp. vulgare]KAE8773453.1 putative auxin efflux carrier component 5 [Hordeum vulgare]
MITGLAVYHVVEAMAPLYTAAVLGYASVRWLKAFSEEQCAGINHFVAIYAVPVLIFNMVSTNNPYAMNGRLVAADTLQKAVMLLGLVAWAAWESRSRRRRRRSDDGGGKAAASAAAASPLQWVVTAFSVASLPNTIIMGVPLLGGMYGAMSKDLMKQIVVMQFCVWYNVVIFIYEYMAARRAATAVDGGAKISPGSPGAVPSAEKIATHDEAAVAAKRAHEVTVNIEITEVTPASTTQQKDGPDDTTTTSADAEAEQASSPPAKSTAPSVRHIALMAGKKVLKIPNTYASFLGLIWALIAFKCGMKMPKIIDDSLFTIQTTAVGLSMFASGTFIARQSRFVPCGYAIASMSMVLKFLIGPVVMLLASLAIGMHGTLLHIAVVQAALPLAVTSFVYAEEYKVHADIMSTGVILGIFISLPVTIVYYIVLGL